MTQISTIPSAEERLRQIAAKKSQYRKTDIFFVVQEGVTEPEQRAALEGILEVLKIADQKNNIRVTTSSSKSDFHSFALENLNRISHSGHMSADEIEESGKSGILEKMREEKSQGRLFNYLMLLKDNIGAYGSAKESLGGIVSVAALGKLEFRQKMDLIKTLVMHELGHVYGLIPDNRTINVEEALGKHCTDICTMRQVYSIADIARVSADRIRFGPYCRQCTQDLRAYFS